MLVFSLLPPLFSPYVLLTSSVLGGTRRYNWLPFYSLEGVTGLAQAPPPPLSSSFKEKKNLPVADEKEV